MWAALCTEQSSAPEERASEHDEREKAHRERRQRLTDTMIGGVRNRRRSRAQGVCHVERTQRAIDCFLVPHERIHGRIGLRLATTFAPCGAPCHPAHVHQPSELPPSGNVLLKTDRHDERISISRIN